MKTKELARKGAVSARAVPGRQVLVYMPATLRMEDTGATRRLTVAISLAGYLRSAR